MVCFLGSLPLIMLGSVVSADECSDYRATLVTSKVTAQAIAEHPEWPESEYFDAHTRAMDAMSDAAVEVRRVLDDEQAMATIDATIDAGIAIKLAKERLFDWLEIHDEEESLNFAPASALSELHSAHRAIVSAIHELLLAACEEKL